jgi:hypothetical protein
MPQQNEKIAVISKLQLTSYEVFCSIIPHLKAGMSEFDIAASLRNAFAKRAIVEFWYDVPIIVLIGAERLINGANADYPTKPLKERRPARRKHHLRRSSPPR